MHSVLSLENVSKFYSSQTSVVVGLSNMNLRFSRGEFVAITGESGSGKSTLSNVIGGILGYESGEMLFEGKPTSHYDSSDWERYRRDHISYISQDYGILPGASVMSNVVSALRLAGVEKAAAKERAKDILRQMELWPLRNRRASKLSSGQKQRLSIGRALAKPAPILIADEPTGNLDPENSAKVIDLLAQAAKSRLVLLVTHEFGEVKEHATRHIRLHDGVVVVDTQLCAANEPEEIPQLPTKARKEMSLFVTGLQLRSRPVWTALMTLLFTLSALAVVAFMGTFVVALDDTNTKLYDPSSFINGSPERIVVSRNDLLPMTQEDYDAIANLKYVTQLERNGYVSDAQYAYREGVDYTKHYKEVEYEWGSHTEVTFTFHSDAPYIQLVPVLPQGQNFLKEGRLPESFYEVVANTADGFQIGDEVLVFLANRRYWPNSAYLEFSFEVVGLTDQGEGLYFSDDMGRYFQHVAHTHGNAQYYQFLPQEMEEWRVTQYDDIPRELLPEDFSFYLKDGECMPHQSIRVRKQPEEDLFGSLTMRVPNVNLINQSKDPLATANLVSLSTPREYEVEYWEELTQSTIKRTIQSAYAHYRDYFTNLMFVSYNTFNELCWNQISEQVSITIEDYAYAQRVMDELKDKGYLAISPYRLGSTKVVEEKAQQREQTLTVCLLALLAVVVLQILVLRALCGVQLGSYRLLRNIGLVRKSAKRSVYWQFLLFTILGQLITAAVLCYCWEANVEKVVRLLRYLPPTNLAALSLLHLAGAMTAAFWSVRALQKQIYPVADRFVDLQMDEEVAV